jgi:glycosyltransferase involved in cell wall biosynthesis
METVIRHGRNGYLVEDNAPECLARGMAAVISGNGSSAGPAEEIRASVSGFGWDTIAARIAEEYRAAFDTAPIG